MRRRRIIERSSRGARVNLSRRRARRRSPRVRLHFLIYSLFIFPQRAHVLRPQTIKKKRHAHVRVYRALPLSSLSVLFTLREQLLGGERIERLSSKECFSLNEEREKRHARKRRFTMWIFVFFPTAFLSLERTLFFSKILAFAFFFVCDRVRTVFCFFSGHRCLSRVIKRHHEPHAKKPKKKNIL